MAAETESSLLAYSLQVSTQKWFVTMCFRADGGPMVVAGETAAETYIHVLDQILLQGMLAVLDLEVRSPK